MGYRRTREADSSKQSKGGCRKFYIVAFPNSIIAQEVAEIAYHYKYDTEYILLKPIQWRKLLLNKAREQISIDKLWLLDNTILTHQPNTQSDADRMSDTINRKQEELTNAIMLARGLTTEAKLREKQDLEDGIMYDLK